MADAGSGGITRNELTRKTQFIRKSFRDEYLADLIESGELVMMTGARGTETYKIEIKVFGHGSMASIWRHFRVNHVKAG